VHVAVDEAAAAGDHEEPVEAALESEEMPTEIPVREQDGESVEIDVRHAETDEPGAPGDGEDFDDSDETTQETVLVTVDESQADGYEEDDDVSEERGEPIEDPHFRELEESTRTMRLSREEVDAAIQTPPDDAVDGPEAWEPPADLEQSILCFNAMQRLIYRTVRSEVGAGAANFIRACCDDDGPNVIEGAELQADGTWDNAGLRRQVVEHRIEEPWELYRRLIGRELDVLRSHVGEAKIVELQREVDKVSETHAP